MERSNRRVAKIGAMKKYPTVKAVATRLALLKESVKCSICLDIMMQPARINCGHTFCTVCIENAIQFNKPHEGSLFRKYSGGGAKANCPLCKKSNITKRSIVPDPVLEEKVKLVQDVLRNLKLAAEEIGLDLDSVRVDESEYETIGKINDTTRQQEHSVTHAKTAKKRKTVLATVYTDTINTTHPAMKTYGTGPKNTKADKGTKTRSFDKPNKVICIKKKRDISIDDPSVTEELPRKKCWKGDVPNDKLKENARPNYSLSDKENITISPNDKPKDVSPNETRQDLKILHLQEKPTKCLEGGNMTNASCDIDIERHAPPRISTSPLSTQSQTKTVPEKRERKKVPFLLRGTMLHIFKTINNSSKPKNVVFVKIGKLVQNETLKLPAPKELSQNFGSKLDENGMNDIRLEQNPDQNYVGLQTEAFASVASNTHNINSQSSLNGHLLINEAAEHQRPMADDFDDINEEDEMSSFSQTTDAKIIFAEKSKNRALYSNKEMESFHSRFGNTMDSKINERLDSDNGTKSVEESDEEDLFAATPENVEPEPMKTSTNKQNRIQNLSQSFLPQNDINWKDLLENFGGKKVFENLEIALHGDFGSGISGGQVSPSKSELLRLLIGRGAKIYNSVNLFTFARGVTGICIVDQSRKAASNQTSRPVSYVL